MKLFHEAILNRVFEHGLARVDEIHNREDNALYAEVADADLADKFPREWAEALKTTEPSEKEFARSKASFEAFRAFCARDRLPSLPASGFSLVWWGLDLALVQNKTLAQVKRSLDAIQAVHHEMGHHVADRYTEAALAIAKKLLAL